MKYLIPLALFLSGCAHFAMNDYMQPDGSYRIFVGGNAFASPKQVKEIAESHAKGLCPNGYEVKTEFDEMWGNKPAHTLIAKCNQ